MIKVAIVEDEKECADLLEGYLHQYEDENQEVFEITRYSDGDGIVVNFRGQFDIILMDVQMKFMDGMSAAEEIRKADQEVVIIFITNMRQYALRGYAVNALDYVLKPVNYFAFSERLGRAIYRMRRKVRSTLIINVKGGMVKLDISDLCYVESRGHVLLYHTVREVYESYGTMKEMDQTLEAYHFVRGNKGYLINLAYVDSISGGMVTVNGEELVLSRARKNAFLEALTEYWAESR